MHSKVLNNETITFFLEEKSTVVRLMLVQKQIAALDNNIIALELQKNNLQTIKSNSEMTKALGSVVTSAKGHNLDPFVPFIFSSNRLVTGMKLKKRWMMWLRWKII